MGQVRNGGLHYTKTSGGTLGDLGLMGLTDPEVHRRE